MTDKSKIKIIEHNDVKGLINAVSDTNGDLSGGGHFHSIQAKEQVKKALARQGIVEFTEQEIKTMPKTFRKLLILQKKRRGIRKPRRFSFTLLVWCTI